MLPHSGPFCLSWVQSKELPRHGLCRSDFFLLKFFQESSAEAGVVGSSAAFSLLPNGTNRNGAAQNTMADAHWFTFHRYNSCEITSHQALRIPDTQPADLGKLRRKSPHRAKYKHDARGKQQLTSGPFSEKQQTACKDCCRKERGGDQQPPLVVDTDAPIRKPDDGKPSPQRKLKSKANLSGKDAEYGNPPPGAFCLFHVHGSFPLLSGSFPAANQ